MSTIRLARLGSVVPDRIPAASTRPRANAPRAARDGARAVADEPLLPGTSRSDPRSIERMIDPNRILQRIEHELRALAGDSVKLEIKLDPELGFAAAQNVPLKAIARTLVMNAREAMPEGGELVIESANLEIAGGEPGEMPAVAPDRYVTIAFRDSGAEPDAAALARLFEPASAEIGPPSGSGRLALSTVYRVLQVCGGDLSVKVEPGRGSTFTVFLPRAREPLRAARKTTPALATTPGPTPR